MTTWRDNFQTPTVAGVEIHAETAAATDGRFIAAHSPPRRDTPHIQRLGAKPRRFSLTGLIMGDDPAAAAARLATASNAGAAVIYTDTNGDSRRVWLENITRQTDRQAGGSVRVSLQMVAADSKPSPAAAAAPATAAANAAAALIDTDADIEKIGNSAETAETIRAQILTHLNPPALPPHATLSPIVAARRAQLIIRPRQNWTDAAAQAAAPQWNAAEIAAAALLQNALSTKTPGDFITAAYSLILQYAPPLLIDGVGFFGKLLWRNKTKIYKTTRRNLIAAATLAAARHAPDTRQQGEAARNSLTAAIYEENRQEQDTAYIDKLATARAAVVDYYDEILPTLAKMVAYNPQTDLPAIAAAYRYENSTANADLIARRAGVNMPLFTRPPILIAAAA